MKKITKKEIETLYKKYRVNYTNKITDIRREINKGELLSGSKNISKTKTLINTTMSDVKE